MGYLRVIRWAFWLFGAAFSVGSCFALDFTWTAGSDVAVPVLNQEDADAGLVQDDATLWIQTALYPRWSRFSGTNLDNLVALPDAVRDSSFNSPHGDDAYWTNGIWQDAAGVRHAIVHIEYQYAAPRTNYLWKRRIGLATSSDQGANWHYAGDIITTNPARAGSPDPATFQDFGCGDTYLCIDRQHGFFYVFYMTAWVRRSDGWRIAQAISVARCAFSDAMAPGKWTKWNGTSWTEPGLGGVESSVFSGTDSAVIHFNFYLKEFVAIGHDSNDRSWISASSDLALQDWQIRDYSFPQRLLWYNWPVDPTTHDRYEIGQNLRIYSAQANVNGVGTKYLPLQFVKNNNAAPTVILVSPEENTVSFAADSISLIASASDPGGSIAKVEFFANQIKLGETSLAPYVFAWKNVPLGNYRIAARATDNLGAATESSGIDLSVQPLNFLTWKASRHLPATLPDDQIQANGLSPLLTYALNIDSASALPKTVIDAEKLTLTYSPIRSDVTYLVERSTDLLNWSSNLVDQGSPSGAFITASTPLDSQKKIFLRIKVTHP